MNSLPALVWACPIICEIIKSELVACVQTVHGCELGRVAVAYHRFVLFHPGL